MFCERILFMVIRRYRYILIVAVVLGLAVQGGNSSVCVAGGGPENVFLLVNSSSIDSMTVANHYIDLRKLPPQNVFYLDWRRSKGDTQGSVFREEILQPALEEINKRKLGGQIDYLVYSCDFPWRINFQRDFPNEKFGRGMRPLASTTGATFLWPFTMGKRKEMFGLNTNFYFSARRAGMTFTRGFKSSYFWNAEGRRTTKDKGVPYLLSTMLGVTYGRGNTVDEIIRYLERAAQADGTKPKGTIYYVKNDSPRSTPRHDDFPQAVADLKMLGVHAEIEQGRFLRNKTQVMGVTCGGPVLKIAASGTRFLPGALGDNLTSAGGNLVIRKTKGPDQTPISEFLRFGCAGACGTVAEPLNFPQKFPSAFLHVHYARGSSLAEAFYQSIAGPFQQLIIGDPICQPWANISEVSLEDITEGQRVSDTLKIKPSLRKGKAKFFEFFVDGRRIGRRPPGEEFSIDTKTLPDGYHELRVVATDNTPFETVSRWVGEIVVKNGMDALQLSTDVASVDSSLKALNLTVASSAEGSVAILHNGRKLASVNRGNGSALIPIDKLGKGPVSLIAVTEGEKRLQSRPLRVDIP